VAEHVPGHEIPGAVIVPEPAPITETVSVRDGVNVAVTAASPPSGTVHVPVPEHAPDQPVKIIPGPGVAVRATFVPGQYCAEQPPGQVSRPLASVTLPEPTRFTLRVCSGKAKLAVTLVVELVVGVGEQVPAPEQPPPFHPTNAAPPAGVAVNVTGPPAGYLAEHVPGQEIGPGVALTAPLSAPSIATLSAAVLSVWVPAVTRYSVTLCGGTSAEIAPVVVVEVFAHRSRTV
jgi:hypothetical protein